MKKMKVLVVVAAVVVAAGVAMVVAVRGGAGGGAPTGEETDPKGGLIGEVDPSKPRAEVQPVKEVNSQKGVRPPAGKGGKATRKDAAAGSDETADDDIDEEGLNEVQKAVLKELQEALDANSLPRVRKALAKFRASPEKVRGGCGGHTPACMRSKAVSALGWFGKDASIDLIDFVADANEDVANEAFSQFESTLSDGEMGDAERSQILTSVMTVLTDTDQIESLLTQLNDMRNSVKAQTVQTILTTGTDAAKAMMTENLDFYLDDGVTDASGVAKWVAANPDDPSDNETYGGSGATSGGASN